MQYQKLFFPALLAILILMPLSCSKRGKAAHPGRPGNDTAPLTLLNVSYDPTRELYRDIDSAFSEYWQKKRGEKVIINQSHGGSGAQAQSVINGLEADIVTLASAYDIDAISRETGLIKPDWRGRFPGRSCPYTSTIVFLVRKGNPRNVRDWDDLIKPGLSVITPNPRTSGGARWNYLAAWGYALRKGNENTARDFVTRLFRNVPVLDSGARGATITFVEREIGDVLLAWENEALLSIKEMGSDSLEIVMPSISILAEPPVAVVDGMAEKHGVSDVAKAYLAYLYSEKGQEIIARHYYRPHLKEAAKKSSARFPHIELFTIDEAFGGWKAVHEKHFIDGGIFDGIYDPGKR